MQSEVASGTSKMTRKKTAARAVIKKSRSPERKATVRPSAKAASVNKGATAKTTAKAAPAPAKAAGGEAKPALPPIAQPPSPPTATRAIAAAAIGKGGAQRVAAPATPKVVAERAAQARQQAASKKPVNQRHGFKTNEWIVYPAHGVGRIVGIEEQEIAGISLELFVITFEKDKMTLRVPTGKSQSVGMRKLAEEPTL